MFKKGDTIGLITPSGFINKEKLKKTIDTLQSFGLQAKYSDSVLEKDAYLAGTDQSRVNELHSMYLDNSTKAILCVRGGFGVTRILDKIDYSIIKKNPKPLIGYSDITALLSAVYKKTNIPGFHGIVGASEFTEYTKNNFRTIFIENQEEIKIEQSETYSKHKEVLFPGKAEGIMIGGNLSLLTSLLGTDYDLDWSGKIVYIEEINEAPYKIDRMLTQLKLAGKFSNVKALIFGIFHKCNTKDFNIRDEDSYKVKEIIYEKIQELRVPTAYGFSFGHIDDQAIFPFGMPGIFDAEACEIRVNTKEFADFF